MHPGGAPPLLASKGAVYYATKKKKRLTDRTKYAIIGKDTHERAANTAFLKYS